MPQSLIKIDSSSQNYRFWFKARFTTRTFRYRGVEGFPFLDLSKKGKPSLGRMGLSNFYIL